MSVSLLVAGELAWTPLACPFLLKATLVIDCLSILHGHLWICWRSANFGFWCVLLVSHHLFVCRVVSLAPLGVPILLELILVELWDLAMALYTTKLPPRRKLHESGLTLQDLQSLFETRNFICSPLLTLSVRLCLGNAHVLKFRKRLHNSIKLLLNSSSIRGHFRNHLVKLDSLSCLVLHISLLGNLDDGILLLLLVVGHCRGFLCGFHLRQSLGEVRLNDFEHTDDSCAGALGVSLLSRAIVVPEHLECDLHSFDAGFEFRLIFQVLCVLLLTNLVRLCLLCNERCELLLQQGHGLLQLGRLGCLGVDASAELLDLSFFVLLLLLRISHFLVAVGLLLCLRACFLLKLCDQVCDEPTNLHKRICTGCGSSLNEGVESLGEQNHRARCILHCQVAHKLHDLDGGSGHSRLASGLRSAGSPRPQLNEAESLRLLLLEVICLRCSCSALLVEHIQRFAESGKFLASSRSGFLVILSCADAISLEVREASLILAELLAGALQVTLRICSCLCALLLPLLGSSHVIIAVLDVILERLLKHVEVVPRLGLCLSGIFQLLLRLLKQVIQGVKYATAVVLICCGSRRPKLCVVQRVGCSALHERCQPLCVGRAESARLHESREDLRQAFGPLQLQFGALALEAFALNDSDGSLDHADCLGKLLALGREVCRLLLSHGCRLCQLLFGLCDGS
mmetsp:Transcript_66958/g.160371  ORF Transcript_66958/g.160371 Transcript_66958/m.160371 type:complete len:684 (+) Transcript_66958:223-2274(+)